MQIIGQKHNLELIEKWKELPQFIIITGEDHIGKTYFTQYLCKKYGLHYHKMSNDIKSVKNLVSEMSPNSKTLYHFKDFNSASIQSKNALLKITEEPIPGNYIVITGSNTLSTLESRGRKIILNPYSLEEFIEYSKTYIDDVDYIENLYMCGINTPAKLFLYKDVEDLKDLLELVNQIFTKLTYIGLNDIFKIIQMFDYKYDKELDKCLLFLNMLISYIEFNLCIKQLYSYKSILAILMSAKYDLIKTPSLNRKMLLYDTFYQIFNLREN